jgi:outer membrane lipoprotein-sorting protein
MGRGKPQIPSSWPPLLQKAFANAFKLTYSGTRVVIFRRGPERRKTTEYILKNGRRIRITFPEDSIMAGQVIVEDGRERQHYFPSQNEIRVGPTMHDDAFESLRLFLKSPAGIKIVASGSGVVAGHKGGLLHLNDAKGNTVQKLWIDEKTGLILKREMFDPTGSVVASFEFTAVNYSPIVRSEDFRIVRQGARVVTPEDVARKLMQDNGMLLAFLPQDKFRRLMGSRVLSRVAESKVLILTYSTGRAPLSLVQAAGGFDPARLRRLAGPQFKIHTWQFGGRTFALIGDYSEDDLRRLAEKVSIR